MYRAGILCAAPMLLLMTFYFPLHTPAPTRDQLRDALHDLDNQAYAQSGCSDVASALARCQQTPGTCNTLYAQELRNLSRNCRSIRCVWVVLRRVCDGHSITPPTTLQHERA